MAFTVEDGSSVEGANSYVSVADADTYIAEYKISATSWDNLSDANKQIALENASRYLDSKYGGRWKGVASDNDQGLDWPRSNAYNHDGVVYDSDALPTVLTHAVCEVANYYAENSYQLFPEMDSEGGIKKQTMKIGALDFSTEYAGTKISSEVQSMVYNIIRELLQPGRNLLRG